MPQREKLQPRVIRVTAYKNGSRTVFAKVTAPTISLVTNVQKFSVLHFFPYSLYNTKDRKMTLIMFKFFLSNMNVSIAYVYVELTGISFPFHQYINSIFS